MIDETTGISKLAERMTLWLPGAFSVFFLVLAGLAPVMFLLTGHALAGITENGSLLLLFVGLLGGAINGVLIQQQRRIRALESVLRAITLQRST